MATTALLLSGCSQIGTGTKTAPRPNAIAIAIAIAASTAPIFDSWSPAASSTSDTSMLVFSGLTKLSAAGQLQPDLATSWTADASARTWTFQLRSHVHWQDGQAFSARDVAFTFNSVVRGRHSHATGASTFSDVSSVQAKGAGEVIFHLKRPLWNLPWLLAQNAPILPAHLLQSARNPLQDTSFAKHPVGTGPFMLKKQTSKSFTLVRNPHYFLGPAHLKTITIRVIPSRRQQVKDLKAGNVNLVSYDTSLPNASLRHDRALRIHQTPRNLTYWVALNESNATAQSARIHEALLYAINRPTLIQSALQGYGTVASTPIAKGHPLYDNKITHYPYQPSSTAQILTSLGYKRSASGMWQKGGATLAIALLVGNYGPLPAMAKAVIADWRANGIDASLKEVRWDAWIQQVVIRRQYQATLAFWATPENLDLLSQYGSGAAGTGYNIPGDRDPMLDTLLQKGSAALTLSAKQPIYNAIQRRLSVTLPYLYLAYPDRVIVTRGLSGITSGNMIEAVDQASTWRAARP